MSSPNAPWFRLWFSGPDVGVVAEYDVNPGDYPELAEAIAHDAAVASARQGKRRYSRLPEEQRPGPVKMVYERNGGRLP